LGEGAAGETKTGACAGLEAGETNGTRAGGLTGTTSAGGVSGIDSTGLGATVAGVVGTDAGCWGADDGSCALAAWVGSGSLGPPDAIA
jgi:hypothetical protein